MSKFAEEVAEALKTVESDMVLMKLRNAVSRLKALPASRSGAICIQHIETAMLWRREMLVTETVTSVPEKDEGGEE